MITVGQPGAADRPDIGACGVQRARPTQALVVYDGTLVHMTTIFLGWPEQYERMLRSHGRLTNYARGNWAASSDEARDALIHFFQDAYHLKDWLRNDLGQQAISNQPARNPVAQHIKDAVEGYVSSTFALQLCADIANGSKHLGLRPGKPGKPKSGPRTGDVTTAVTGQGVVVRPASVGSGMAPDPAIHSWRIESGGNPYDALDKADEVVVAWQVWLRKNGLL